MILTAQPSPSWLGRSQYGGAGGGRNAGRGAPSLQLGEVDQAARACGRLEIELGEAGGPTPTCRSGMRRSLRFDLTGAACAGNVQGQGPVNGCVSRRDKNTT